MVTIAALESLSPWQRRQSRASPHHSTGRRNSSPSSTNFTRWTEEPREENGRHHPAGRCLLGFTDDQGAEPCLSGHLETICILPVGTAANCYFTARFSLYFPSCRPAHGFRKDFDRIFIRNRGFREKCMLTTRIKGIAAAYWKPVPFLFLAEAFGLISNESGRIIITEILPNVFHTELGDLGLVAEASRSSQKMMYKPKPLTIARVLDTFQMIAKESGKDRQDKKRSHIKGLLVAATDCEPQYVIRLLQSKMRIGLAEKTVQMVLGQAAVYSEKGLCHQKFNHLLKRLMHTCFIYNFTIMFYSNG